MECMNSTDSENTVIIERSDSIDSLDKKLEVN